MWVDHNVEHLLTERCHTHSAAEELELQAQFGQFGLTLGGLRYWLFKR